MLEACLRLLLALVAAAGLGVFGWAITLRLAGEGCGRLARWVAAFIAASGVGTVVFVALGFARILGTASLVVSSLALAAGALRAAGRERIAASFDDDLSAISALPKRIGRPATVLVAIVGIAHVLRAAATAVSDPLGFDTMTYHMVHVAHWAQDGGFARHPGIDAWGYYEFFPIGGEIFYAWVAIPTRSNVLVGASGIFLSAMTALGTVTAARALGASLARGVLTACAIVSLPAVLSFATNGYVDNTALAFVVSATALFFSAVPANEARLRGILLVLSCAGFGLAVGVKTTMLPMLGLGVVSSAVLLVVRRASLREIAVVLGAGVAAALIIFGPRMLYVASVTGSPMYPFPLRVMGHEIFRGNSNLQRIALDPKKAEPSTWALVKELFFPLPHKPPINFGHAGLPLFASAAIGMAMWFRRRPRDARALVLLGLVVPVLSFFTGETTLGLRAIWWWVIARFMTPAAFAVAMFSATVPDGRVGRVVDVLLGAATLLGLLVPFSHGMCGYRWIGAVSIGAGVAAACGLAVFVWRQHKRAVPVVLALGVVALAAATVALRGELAGLVMRGATRGQCFEAHPMRRPATGYPLWERLADDPPKRIALVAGFEGVGHEVFRYPLLGRDWQHTILQVSPAEDGKLYDFADVYWDNPGKTKPELSFERWFERLREARVDYVVLLGPYNVVEHRWLTLHPELFEFEEISESDAARLYAVKR